MACWWRRNYWIQGKAASGKSTLMRFIWNNPWLFIISKTGQQVLNRWWLHSSSGIAEFRCNGRNENCFGLCFTKFSIVIGIWSQNIFGNMGTQIRSGILQYADHPKKWSQARLQEAFEQLVNHCNETSKNVFFHRWPRRVKFCLPSRPWPVFLDIYSETPGLRLQDLTPNEIKIYIRDKLE